jgi:hypothetical protein
MEKNFLSASIIFGLVCVFAFISVKAQEEKKAKSPILQHFSAGSGKTTNGKTVFSRNDSVPIYKVGGGLNLKGETNTSFDGKEYRVVVDNSVVTEIYIDGQKVPAEKIIDYKAILDKLYSKMIENEKAYRSRQAIREGEQAMRDSEQAIRDGEQVMRESGQIQGDREQAIKDREQAMRDRKQAITLAGPRNSETSVSSMRQETIIEEENIKKIIQELIEDKIITSGENLSFLLSEVKFIVNDKKKPIEIVKKYYAKYGFKGFDRLYNFRTDYTVLPVSPVSPVSPVRADDSNVESIINELIAAKIIKGKNELKSLSLNVTELLVNGVKQPAAIHQKLKDKYVKSDTVTLWYEIE